MDTAIEASANTAAATIRNSSLETYREDEAVQMWKIIRQTKTLVGQIIIDIACLLTYDKSGGSEFHLLFVQEKGLTINYHDVNRDFYLND